MITIQIFLAGLDLLGVLIVGLVGSLAVTGLSSKGPGQRVSILLDAVGLNDNTLQVQVALLGAAAGVLLILKTCLTMYFSKRVTFFLARRSAVISSNLIKRYFSRPITSIRVKTTQESIYALTGGVNAVTVGLIGGWSSLIADFTLLVILGIGLFIVNIQTSLATLLIFAITGYLLQYFMHDKIQRLGANQALLSIRSNEQIDQAIHSYRELLVRNRRGYYAEQIAKSRFILADGSAAIGFLQSLNKYIFEIAMVVTSIFLAAYQFSTETASRAIAVVGIFIAASARIMPAVVRVQQGLLSIRANIGITKPTIELIHELRDLEPINDESNYFRNSHETFEGRIEISGLNFSYSPKSKVLIDINLAIKPGEFVGIVGASGAGKTTLVDVILGAITPETGIVTVSGLAPLSAYSKWPGAVSYIPQDITIINGSIRENICLGYPVEWISDEECWESLEMAQLADFVRLLPEGLDSHVGDRGNRLSGGQRQRLGISRALITKPKLLILDEATSALDGVTESEISEELRNFRGEITLIVIAHRLSTIVDADRIYMMNKGKIIGQGNFEELKSASADFRLQAEVMGL